MGMPHPSKYFEGPRCFGALRGPSEGGIRAFTPLCGKKRVTRQRYPFTGEEWVTAPDKVTCPRCVLLLSTAQANGLPYYTVNLHLRVEEILSAALDAETGASGAVPGTH